MVTDHRAVFPILGAATEANTVVNFCLPGTPFVKNAMRNNAAVFGTELTGRYYFNEFWWSECNLLAAFLMIRRATLGPLQQALDAAQRMAAGDLGGPALPAGDDDGGDGLQFDSREGVTASRRPRLVIVTTP